MKVKGIVIKGKSEGKKLGFPTANIVLREKISSGVYRAEVKLDAEKYKAAVFVGAEENLLEAHLLDFSDNLYGKEVEVTLKEKIRDVIPFQNMDQMKNQIQKDIQEIRKAKKSKKE